jgi:hypothetical protein
VTRRLIGKNFKEIYMDGLLRLLRQAKRRMLSRRGQHASLSYNMSLLPDSSRGSVLLRNTRMGNNVPKEQVAPGQGVHCRYWVLRYSTVVPDERRHFHSIPRKDLHHLRRQGSCQAISCCFGLTSAQKCPLSSPRRNRSQNETVAWLSRCSGFCFEKF